MEKEIRAIHTKLNDGKITVTQATDEIIELINCETKQDDSELFFLQEKMKEAIIYQGYFGKDGDEKLDRQAKNCAIIAKQFFDKKQKLCNN